MTEKNPTESRRRLIKAIALGSGAIVAGKSLPDNWLKPVVEGVMLPAHANTSIHCQPYPLSLTAEVGWINEIGINNVQFVIYSGYDGVGGDAIPIDMAGNFSGTIYADGGNCANGSPIAQDGTFTGVISSAGPDAADISGSFTLRILCGGVVICTASGDFSATGVPETSIGSLPAYTYAPASLTSVTSECCPDTALLSTA